MRDGRRRKRSLCWEMGKVGVKAVAMIYGAVLAVNTAVRWIQTGSLHEALVDTLVRAALALPIIVAGIIIIVTVASAGRAFEEALG